MDADTDSTVASTGASANATLLLLLLLFLPVSDAFFVESQRSGISVLCHDTALSAVASASTTASAANFFPNPPPKCARVSVCVYVCIQSLRAASVSYFLSLFVSSSSLSPRQNSSDFRQES
ncbi:hypothetical protein ECG_09308 [Echinococcus granulosus]|uniref:Secreted protein n=1 Tax=Echinococcus granulosus TaxID=6210 RepID=U6JH09_ECHGR|nr:hypothetical protein EGR_06284 [Echinococcus granulosus]EUB58860.1 hypothetical protein EGR_06284 [Echinococcus granulosus]KAH9278400.1 hypothetical protein ECG_09308 [Echinococcus granulosus]CDS23348.1 hypothetical protein EgrG_002039500 [Echinococcus granulosus]